MLNNHETSNMKTSWWFAWSTNRSRPFDSFPTNQRREVDRHGLVDFQNYDPRIVQEYLAWVLSLSVCLFVKICLCRINAEAGPDGLNQSGLISLPWIHEPRMAFFFHKYYFLLFSRLKKKRSEMLRIQILQVTIGHA